MEPNHTSESVTEGHPDKVADRISDAVLDAYLTEDPHSRVAVDVYLKDDLVVVGGEITSTGRPDIEAIVRRVVADIGYHDPALGFSSRSCRVLVEITEQSGDIARGVDSDDDGILGAGDQGLMFGYATDASPSHLPVPLHLAHRLAERLTEVRRAGIVDWLRPDGKTQVSIDPDDPHRITHLVVSTQHAEHASTDEVRDLVRGHVLNPELVDHDWSAAEVHINPTGRFVTGGPVGDAGLTGRKIIVDTYGGEARHGGGAFSGKDPTKVDRSAAYALRAAALWIVRRGLARRCEVQAAYAIGHHLPLRLSVETFGTSPHDSERLRREIVDRFDLTPSGIIAELDLRRPIYEPTAAYGHFGRPGFPWEDER